jgi:hypothetical protein
VEVLEDRSSIDRSPVAGENPCMVESEQPPSRFPGWTRIAAALGCAALLAAASLLVRIELTHAVLGFELLAGLLMVRALGSRLTVGIWIVVFLGDALIEPQRLFFGAYPAAGFAVGLVAAAFLVAREPGEPGRGVKLLLLVAALAPYVALRRLLPTYPYFHTLLAAAVAVGLLGFWRMRVVRRELWFCTWGLAAYYALGLGWLLARAALGVAPLEGALLYGYVYRLPADLLQALIAARMDHDLELPRVRQWLRSGRLPPLEPPPEDAPAP